MKKTIITLTVALFACSFVFAQENEREKGTVTKSGRQILPQAGDFAIGVDAYPFLNYAGNMFNGSNSNNTPSFGGATLYGKYFLQDNRALRVRLLLDLSSETYKNLVPDDAATAANPTAEVEDKLKEGTTKIGLSVGYEFRRGYGRLQGFYGIEAGLGFESYKNTYEYGNPFTNTHQLPTTTTNFINGTFAQASVRPTSEKSGSQFSFEAGAFAGVEFFVAPKLSIGGEVGLGLSYATTPKGKATVESWDAANSIVKATEGEAYTGAPGHFGFETVTRGALFVMFHF